ncbi:tyrosine-type recombinase/integrase [Melissococcus plutonius]|uniref:tyrosine-type recombinase/integrase n=1 Tax=Melissococcus plutonius TaxID=33970 RepID=UPI0009B613B0
MHQLLKTEITYFQEKKYGFSHIISHDLRHTFVSDLLNQGINGLIIKSLVDHAEISNMI